MKAARRLFLATFTLALMLEAQPYSTDALAMTGWYLHQDIKKWLPIGLPFSLMELLLLATAAFWLARGPRARRAIRFDRGQLLVPIVAFTAAVAFGVLWGLARGGDNLTFALFEVRGLAMVVFAYLLVGMLFRDDRDLNPLIWCLLLACAGLAIQNIARYYLVFSRSVSNDLMYDHTDSLILGFGAILCLALPAFNGTRAQRRVGLLLFPCLLACEAVMHRRAAWPVLFVGLVMLAIMVYRARPKIFWRVVPLLTLLIVGYLAVFWNNTGSLGQPARAIRSQFAPDPRDASSDQYRITEHYDIVANIRSSRVLGLGFGQPYVFYAPLPDLSFWPFWHYESHNSVLWLWMDGGIPLFFSFMWLAGAGLAAGAQELNARRETWTLPRLLPRRPGRMATPAPPAATTRAAATTRGSARRPHSMTAPRPGRAPASAADARVRGASTALLAAALCFIPMQILFSYVDLGLVDPRDMLLYGVAIGIAARSFTARPASARGAHHRARASAPAPEATSAAPAPRLVTVHPD